LAIVRQNNRKYEKKNATDEAIISQSAYKNTLNITPKRGTGSSEALQVVKRQPPWK
jgi:hypothetical protein